MVVIEFGEFWVEVRVLGKVIFSGEYVVVYGIFVVVVVLGFYIIVIIWFGEYVLFFCLGFWFFEKFLFVFCGILYLEVGCWMWNYFVEKCRMFLGIFVGFFMNDLIEFILFFYWLVYFWLGDVFEYFKSWYFNSWKYFNFFNYEIWVYYIYFIFFCVID